MIIFDISCEWLKFATHRYLALCLTCRSRSRRNLLSLFSKKNYAVLLSCLVGAFAISLLSRTEKEWLHWSYFMFVHKISLFASCVCLGSIPCCFSLKFRGLCTNSSYDFYTVYPVTPIKLKSPILSSVMFYSKVVYMPK